MKSRSVKINHGQILSIKMCCPTLITYYCSGNKSINVIEKCVKEGKTRKCVQKKDKNENFYMHCIDMKSVLFVLHEMNMHTNHG